MMETERLVSAKMRSGSPYLNERSLAMFEALYPRDRYPQGHPDLAISPVSNTHLTLPTKA